MPAPDVRSAPDAHAPAPGHRTASLDGLRGAAALSIFVFHAWLYTKREVSAADRHSVVDYAAHELRLALVAFFVLSGFLLFRPWIRATLDGGRAPDLAAYARARAARILPAYYLAFAGSLMLLWNLAGTPGLRLPPAEQLPLFLVFAQNFTPGSVLKLDPPMWSLAVEAAFYVVLPIFGWLALRLPGRRRAQALVPLALLAAGVAYNWAISGQGYGMTFSKSLPAMLPYFAVGMLAALLIEGREIPGRARTAVLVAGLGMVTADAVLKALEPAGVIEVGAWFLTLRDLPSALGFGLVVVALARSPRTGLLSSRAFVGLGTISYGLYLWHVPVLLFLRGHGLLPLHPVLGLLVALGPAVALATASWVLVERPAIRWARGRNGRGRDTRRAPGRSGLYAAAAPTGSRASTRFAQSAPSQRVP